METSELIAELFRRLESMEDFIIRMNMYVSVSQRDYEAENRAIAGYREQFPYMAGDPEHFRAVTSSQEATEEQFNLSIGAEAPTNKGKAMKLSDYFKKVVEAGFVITHRGSGAIKITKPGSTAHVFTDGEHKSSCPHKVNQVRRDIRRAFGIDVPIRQRKLAGGYAQKLEKKMSIRETVEKRAVKPAAFTLEDRAYDLAYSEDVEYGDPTFEAVAAFIDEDDLEFDPVTGL